MSGDYHLFFLTVILNIFVFITYSLLTLSYIFQNTSMEKFILSLALNLGLILMATAQDDYMDLIVQECCKCIADLPQDLGTDETTMQMGLCMMQPALPYLDQIKEDYGIDFARDPQGEGERLGGIIGMKMIEVCPDELMRLSENVNQSDSPLLDQSASASTPEESQGSFIGEVTALDKEGFVIFTVRSFQGKARKFYWLGFVEMEDGDLSLSYKDLIGEKVRVFYRTREMFDPRLEEYRPFYVIESIEAF